MAQKKVHPEAHRDGILWVPNGRFIDPKYPNLKGLSFVAWQGHLFFWCGGEFVFVYIYIYTDIFQYNM